ncbi:hypothetical protein E2C06_18565 [Dankookia rubra]|uniref:Glycosyltransferase RgtA/B/C/D-like domain-containing protein n=1 Tax=Dankookia rubra TaxID=1442381 RepID=A0A4R5QF13_9PROT|nr:hypothetical protein [Dankookia rubra]TDH61111.1 hypothetical protein E2C06_18565 [Dankookia rubra]
MRLPRVSTAAGRRLAGLAARDRDILLSGLCLAAWAALAGHMLAKLPVSAVMTDTDIDTYAYIALAAYRPPLYGWVVNAYREVTGSFDFLPTVQYLIFAGGLLVFALELGRLLDSILAAVIVLPLAHLHPGIHDAPGWMMTESVYLGFLLLGLGLQFRHARSGDRASLLVAAACFALMTITRSTGAAFLALPLLTALLDPRCRLAAAAGQAGRAMLVIALVLGLAMAWNLTRHGRFEIGSLAGVSLLSKALLLLEPADAADMPPPVAATIPAAVEARQLIGAQPDLAARIRAQFQAGSADLRWATFVPAAEAGWPAWAAADWRERDQLVRPLAFALILRHPSGFLRLWANDWLGLVLQPAYWPAWATGEAADKRAFRACLLQANCWGLDRYDLPVHGLVAMLLASILGTLAALLVLLGAAWRVLRRRAAADTVVFWAVALVLHASLLVTAFFEAGHVRFTVAFHILDLALLSWLATGFARRLAPRPVTDGKRPWARS